MSLDRGMEKAPEGRQQSALASESFGRLSLDDVRNLTKMASKKSEDKQELPPIKICPPGKPDVQPTVGSKGGADLGDGGVWVKPRCGG